MMRRGMAAACAGLAALTLGDAARPFGVSRSDAAPRAARAAALAPLDVTVRTRIRPQTEVLLNRLLVEGRGLAIDGQPVFNGGDKFLPGKIAIGLADLVLETPRDDPRFARYVAGFRQVADLTLHDENEEWGIYYYLLALHKLNQAGLLDQAVSPAALAQLRTHLDWRRFVRPDDLAMVNLPNNYYGVAFSIAQLRQLLGWEDGTAAQALLARTLAHYRSFSDYGFADETDGQGRFDRYSVLLIGEIAARFVEAGVEPPADVRRWLAQSARLLLLRVGPDGDGFEYGRSIGAYGETAFLEVLSVAAYLGVLTDEEREVAYAFCARLAARHMEFWVDPRTGSVNLWDGGRRTDAYRGKHRILGENLSLARQYFYTNDLWNRLGYAGRAPTADLAAWRAGRPRATLTWFSRGEYDRALLTWRDGDRVFGLPLINGGQGQHMNSPYYPIPHAPDLIQGAADTDIPQLTFSYTLKDGAVLRPLAWFRNLAMAQGGGQVSLAYDLTAFDRLGKPTPVRDERLTGRTAYTLSPGRISRRDRVAASTGTEIASVALEFATFSTDPTVRRTGSTWTVAFGTGEVAQFQVDGMDDCRAEAASGDRYKAPTQAFRSVVRCQAGPPGSAADFSWTLAFRPGRRAN